MPKPLPKSFAPDEARMLALKVLADDPFPVMTTVDGDQPCARPVSPLRSDDFVVWIASLRNSSKTAEIEVNPKTELCYMTRDHDQVRITGMIHTITDEAVRFELWNQSPLLKQFIPDVNDPQFILYKVEPLQVRYMIEGALEYTQVPL